ncbi:uncharacterized protein LOC6502512 isoform X2 [Drosophila ananassae]|uniref:uncharacterized protein LOC6502512 isoform X2 n=1 Tax=Drosophila ananassae TaxID=7217 RepID=UPI0013A5CEC7|nr:uncharacterized protein LOC6502512 isoform X2 [Drosophila ananassae]
MLGKVKNSIVAIYMAIGIFYILVNIDVSSTYMGPKRQMWPVDHPAIVLYRHHPNALRKFYWYNTRTPIMVGKMRLKNYMRNMNMLPRYIPTAAQYQDTFASSKRSVYRNYNHMQSFKTTLQPATTADYVSTPVNPMDLNKYKTLNTIAVSAPVNIMETIPVTRPVDFKIEPINPFVPLRDNTISHAERLVGDHKKWSSPDYSNHSWTKCPERIMNLAGQTLADCYRNTIQDYPKDQYSSQSVPSEIPVTTTNLPYHNYVAHTYFTLDDVILPRSSNKFGGTSTEYEPEFRPSPVLTTLMPTDVYTERYHHTTQVTPTTSEAPIFPKTTLIDMDFRSIPYIPSSTESTFFENTIENLTTPEPTIRSTVITKNTTNISYKNRLKSLKAAKNYSSNIETKLKLLKLHLKNLVTTTETPKYIQNYTKSAVVDGNTTQSIINETTTTAAPRRINTNRKLRKFRVLASTRKIPTQKPHNTTDTKVKLEHKKPKRIYERRKHFNVTVAPDISKSTTTENIVPIKHKRRNPVRKTTIQPFEENSRVRNSTKFISNNIVKSRSDRIFDEKNALVTESAIMTISSGNMKVRQPILKIKPKQHSSRKINHIENDNFIPSLPIEVYFKKVNQQ